MHAMQQDEHLSIYYAMLLFKRCLSFSLFFLFFRLCLLLEQSASHHRVDPLHDRVLFWVVRVVLGRDLEDGGDGVFVDLDQMSDIVRDLFFTQQDERERRGLYDKRVG